MFAIIIIVSFGVRERQQTGSGLFMGILDANSRKTLDSKIPNPLEVVFGLAGARKPIPIIFPDSYYSNESP